MSDFSIPGRSDDFENEEVNYIEPGKRPLSSMTPTVITNDEGVKMVVGASGGARITTSVAQVSLCLCVHVCVCICSSKCEYV